MAREDLTTHFFIYKDLQFSGPIFNERINGSGGVTEIKVPTAFFEVSPYWAKTISEAKTVKDLQGFNGSSSCGDGTRHNIQDPQTCIVGEAHHAQFNWDDCKQCSEFSSRFGSILDGGHDGHGNRKHQLIQNVKDFTDHWRTEHNPLIHLDIETEEELPVVP